DPVRNGTSEDAESLEDSLDSVSTAEFLRGIRALGGRAEEGILAALLSSLSEWSGSRVHRVTLESHGRKRSSAELDLSRAIGWFAAGYPLRFDLGPTVGLIEDHIQVRRTMRSVPAQGVGF